MTSKNDRDFSTGVYRCKDPIKNFKIRVRLQRDKSTLIPLPQFQKNGEPCEGTSQNNTEFEERAISWQEKVFSQGELLHYRSEGNCHSPLEEKYHNEVIELCKNKMPKNRLFTYTDADDYNEMENETNNITTESKPVVTHLAKNMSQVRQRNRFGRHKGYGKETYLLNQGIVEHVPSDETKKRNHFLQTSIQTFYILADLSTNESTTEEFEWMRRSEYVLCSLKYDSSSSVIYVTPDFTPVCIGGQTIPYTIEVDDDSRNIFQFWLEHASESLVPEDQEKEITVLSKLLDHQLDIRQLKVGTEFETPRSNTLAVYIMGEIVGAEDFEYDDLFVHYLFELPKGWTCTNPEQLSGVTHKCSTNGIGMAYFGHLFEIHLILNVESLPSELDSVPCWPQLFAEVLSFDSWSRFRVEGYFCMKIPATPGLHSISQPTWRPMSNNPVGELRRFFVGGTPGLRDISSSGIPSTFEGDRLSKLGLQVTNSGILHLRLHIVHQSGLLASDVSGDESAAERHPAFLLERLSAATLVNSVNAVMAAFKKARERMLRAKEGLSEEVTEERHQS